MEKQQSKMTQHVSVMKEQCVEMVNNFEEDKRIERAQQLLGKYEIVGDFFLQHIVNCDVMTVYTTVGISRLCVIWDFRGILLTDVSYASQNPCHLLVAKVKDTYEWNRPNLSVEDAIFVHTTIKPERIVEQSDAQWEVIRYPHYMRHILPPDYFLYERIKNVLATKIFKTEYEIRNFVSLINYTPSYFLNIVKKLPSQWQNVCKNEKKSEKK